MYIEDKLFSENTGETVYQVLMSEDEYSLFSVFQKEFIRRIPKVDVNFGDERVIRKVIKDAELAGRSSKEGRVPVDRIISMR